MNTYLWCEDRASGFRFFQEMFEELGPDVLVETKKNNSQLRQAVEHISDDNRYIIIMDAAVDNPDVLRELTRVERVAAAKPNVTLVKVPCFEFILLSFEKLSHWLYAEGSRIRENRRELLSAREIFLRLVLTGGNAEDVREFNRLLPEFAHYNTEQTAAKLLTLLTQNTGFLTTKGKLGVCFTEDCCSLTDPASAPCGLSRARLSGAEKKREIMEHSVLGEAFRKAGL